MGSSAATRSAVRRGIDTSPESSESEANDGTDADAATSRASTRERPAFARATAFDSVDSFDARVDVVSFDAFGLVVFAGRRLRAPFGCAGERVADVRRDERVHRRSSSRAGRFFRGGFSRARANAAAHRFRGGDAFGDDASGDASEGTSVASSTGERVPTRAKAGVPIGDADFARGGVDVGDVFGRASGGGLEGLRSSTTVPRIDVGVPRIDVGVPRIDAGARERLVDVRACFEERRAQTTQPRLFLGRRVRRFGGRSARRPVRRFLRRPRASLEKRVRRQARFRILQRGGDARAKRQQLRRRMPGVGAASTSATLFDAFAAVRVRPAFVRLVVRREVHPGSRPSLEFGESLVARAATRLLRLLRAFLALARVAFLRRLFPLSFVVVEPDVAPERRLARLLRRAFSRLLLRSFRGRRGVRGERVRAAFRVDNL